MDGDVKRGGTSAKGVCAGRNQYNAMYYDAQYPGCSRESAIMQDLRLPLLVERPVLI